MEKLDTKYQTFLMSDIGSEMSDIFHVRHWAIKVINVPQFHYWTWHSIIFLTLEQLLLQNN
jgi:hypothetical protein